MLKGSSETVRLILCKPTEFLFSKDILKSSSPDNPTEPNESLASNFTMLLWKFHLTALQVCFESVTSE